MPVDIETELEADIAKLDLALKKYFVQGARTIPVLVGLIAQRKKLILPAGIARLSYNAAVKQIENIALDGIVRSLELITENHVALIKLLNMEELLWTNLKEAIKEKDQKEIKRLVVGIDSILDNEMKLVPTEARAQATLVQMTTAQMEKIARLR